MAIGEELKNKMKNWDNVLVLCSDLDVIGFDEITHIDTTHLAERFGCIENVLKATDFDLMFVRGVGKKTLRKIRILLDDPALINRVRHLKREGRLKTEISDEVLDEMQSPRYKLREFPLTKPMFELSMKKNPGVFDFLVALDQAHLSKHCAMRISEHISTMDELLTASERKLMKIPTVGPQTTFRLLDALHSPATYRQLEGLREDNVLSISESIMQTLKEKHIMNTDRPIEPSFGPKPKPLLDAIMLRKDIYEKYGMPGYKTTGSAGVDLRACIDGPITLEPNQVVMVPSGLKIHVNDPNYAAILLPRSGLGAKHGIVLGNLVGLIDSDYQGEMGMSIWNRSDKPFTIEPGDRVAQMVVIRVEQVELNFVDSFEATERGEGGFGSTGKA